GGAGRGGMGQDLGGAAPPPHGFPRRLAPPQREPAVFFNAKAENRIVAAIGREKKPPIRCEDDAACALKGVRRAFLAADWLEGPGARAAREATFHLGKRAARRPVIVYDCVLDFIRLNVEMSRLSVGHAHLFRHARLFRHAHLFRHIHRSCLLSGWMTWFSARLAPGTRIHEATFETAAICSTRSCPSVHAPRQ